jgi:hypothetical protein
MFGHLSSDGKMPDDTLVPGGRKIGILAQDVEAGLIEKTLVPMGADMNNIRIIKGYRFMLAHFGALLKVYADANNPDILVIVKPAYFYKDFNTNDGRQVRVELDTLVQFAVQNNISICIIDRLRLNFNKDDPVSNSNSGGDWTDKPSLAVMVKTEEDDQYILSFEKVPGPHRKSIVGSAIFDDKDNVTLQWSGEIEESKPGPKGTTGWKHALLLLEIMTANGNIAAFKTIKEAFGKAGFLGQFDVLENDYPSIQPIHRARELLTTAGYVFIDSKQDSVKVPYGVGGLQRWMMSKEQEANVTLPIRQAL